MNRERFFNFPDTEDTHQLLPVLHYDLGFPTRNGRPLHVRTDYESPSVGLQDRIAQIIYRFNESR